MNKDTTKITTQEEARQFAIEYQQWIGEQNEIGKEPTLYTTDLVEWNEILTKLAEKFDLVEEFNENGII